MVGASQGSGGVCAASPARLVLEQQRGVLVAQVRAQRVDAAVRGRAVRARRALRRVRVEVVPAVGHLLAARLAAPQRRAVGHGHEHGVVRVRRRARAARRALCNNNPLQDPRHAHSPDMRHSAVDCPFGSTLSSLRDKAARLQSVNLVEPQ